MRASVAGLLALACLAAPPFALAQQDLPANGLFLIAKPTLRDPHFARSVVLVTQLEDGSTVGVIVNRPTELRLSLFLSEEFPTGNYRDRIFLGGPVMRQAIVALFRSDTPPAAAAFHVLKDVYLTMHADNLQKLLADPKAQYRLYAGFSGWAPRQLESEFMRDGWYILPANEKILFRKSIEGLWEELLEQVRRLGPQARN